MLYLKTRQTSQRNITIKSEAISGANYQVSKAWQIRENFKDLFSVNQYPGVILYCRRAADSLNKKIKEVSKIVEMFNKHMIGAINALITNFNNTMAERLNGKIQVLKTVARGYRKFENFRSAILFFNGGLNLYPLN